MASISSISTAILAEIPLTAVRVDLSGVIAAPLAAVKTTSAPVPAWIWILLIVAGTVATITDLRSMRIPNWLTLPLLGAGLVYAFAAGGLPGLYASLGGAAAAGALFIVAYAVLGGGAGDAKLMLACGSWIGLDASIVLLLAVTIVGFVIAMSVVIARGGIRDVPAVIGVGILKTAGGFLFLRSNLAQGAKDANQPVASDGSGPQGEAGPGAASEKSGRPRPKGWLPYAPAILGGIICAWIYLEVFEGQVPGR